MSNPEGRGGFQKGWSGNPSGRPKESPELKALFRTKTQEAFEVLSKLLASEDPRVAIAAAQAILDRGYGKPAQEITSLHSGELHVSSKEQRDAAFRAAMRADK